MAAQNIDGTVDGTGILSTKVPGYDDPADIQAALKLFLYGSTSYDANPQSSSYTGTTAERIAQAKAALPNPSIGRYLVALEAEIDALQQLGIGSSYGSEPTSPISGQIWMSSANSVLVPTAAVAIYQGTEPTQGLNNGLLWIDSSGATPSLKVYDGATSTWKVVA
jgi:hypothetical protein